VTIEKVPAMNQIVQHKMVPPEPVAGSSKYYILPKPGIPPVPTKLSFTKEVNFKFLTLIPFIFTCKICFVEIERKSDQKQNCAANH
jgi:hypothetical protein